MSIVQAQSLSKSYQGRQILSELSFAVDAGDRIGLIGRNGAGKSTLLGILSGRILPDNGQISRAEGLIITVLDQRPLADNDDFAILEKPRFIEIEDRIRELEKRMQVAGEDELESLMEEFSRLQHQFESEGAYDYPARLAKILAGLGLTGSQMQQAYTSLSGGEKMRVTLGKLLLEPADLLLMDEPTNHLDLDGLDWLQDYLLSRQQALIVASHDRWFLDRVCDRIFELENGRLYSYRGTFSQAMEQKKEREERLQVTLGRLEERIRREEEVTQTMLSHRKMKSYHSREKLVRKLKEEMQTLAEEKNPARRMSFSFLPPEEKKDRQRLLLEARGLSKAFDRPLFQGVDLTLRASEKLAILGPNGCGKTTLLDILLGRQEADEGQIRLFGDPLIASMGQNVEFEEDQQTVYDYLASSFPATEVAIRRRLAQFGFREEAMVKKLVSLSGGERHRLYLCSLLELRPPLLILDEPTNHLDIESRRLLEEGLKEFKGALITVSHDRYFIGQVADRVLGFVGERVEDFDDYASWHRHHKLWQETRAQEERSVTRSKPPTGSLALRRARAANRQALSRLEKEIEAGEEERRLFESSPATSHSPEDYERYAALLKSLEEGYHRYFELAESMGREVQDRSV